MIRLAHRRLRLRLIGYVEDHRLEKRFVVVVVVTRLGRRLDWHRQRPRWCMLSVVVVAVINVRI